MDTAIKEMPKPTVISGRTRIPGVSSSKKRNKPALDAGKGAFLFFLSLISPYNMIWSPFYVFLKSKVVLQECFILITKIRSRYIVFVLFLIRIKSIVLDFRFVRSNLPAETYSCHLYSYFGCCIEIT